MIKEAIDRVLELSEPDTIEVDGRTWRKQGYAEITPFKKDLCDPMKLGSLTAFAAFIGTDEMYRDNGLMIHVVSPTCVELVSLLDEHGRRNNYAIAKARIDSHFTTEQWHNQDDFVTSLQAHFVNDLDRAQLLKVCGNLRGGSSAVLTDDGVTQKVSTARGVEMKGMEEMPNPVSLRPWETFAEIEQPERQYIVRVKGDEKPLLALFAVPDPVAAMRTCEKIEAWLRQVLPSEFHDAILG